MKTNWKMRMRKIWTMTKTWTMMKILKTKTMRSRMTRTMKNKQCCG